MDIASGVVSWLTIAAAIGLAVVMTSAAVFHVARKEYGETVLTIALLLLALFVVIGHLVWVPLA